MKQPLALSAATLQDLKKIKAIAFDIDDTFSSAGKIKPNAFSALWALKEAGFWCVPITGRPAGWCDHFSRFWPVNAVVGENGAFTFFIEQVGSSQVRKRLDTLPGLDRLAAKRKLEVLGEEIKKVFPFAKWASDQDYREFDLAIDICEDVPAWSNADVKSLLKLCDGLGAHAKLSSIHVNVWFGDYDKRAGFDRFLSSDFAKANQVPAMNDWIFVGDSPNDEPLFAHFEQSVGVANLGRYLSSLKSLPTWITSRESGDGFVELANALLKK